MLSYDMNYACVRKPTGPFKGMLKRGIRMEGIALDTGMQMTGIVGRRHKNTPTIRSSGDGAVI